MKGVAMEKKIRGIEAKSDESEFYSPLPKGYVKGRTKYIAITGSVISGIGKGTLSSSIAKLLKERGLRVEPLKAEAYFNVDAGTLNPFRHGEVFVLDDGTETDLDLGTYERFIDADLSKDNFITSGKIFSKVIEKERKGEYLGRDVQLIPHVTAETKLFFRELALKKKADVVLIEVGGTVGDYENLYLLEAIRQLKYEEGEENVCVINLTYVLEPSSLGEQKSKAAQFGIKKLIEIGLVPDIIAVRSRNPLHRKVREKISLYANVPIERVIGLHNIEEFYSIPLTLMKAGLDKRVFEVLGINESRHRINKRKLAEWTKKMSLNNYKKQITIAIVGKYTGLRDSYISILKALEHCSAELKAKINIKWIEATQLEQKKIDLKKELKGVNGIIIPGGFGKRGVEGKIECIKYCREHNLPFLGLCLGFQLALVEFARNVLMLKKANSTEFDSRTKHPVVDLLPEQKKIEGLGASMRLGGQEVKIKRNTLAFSLYKNERVRERFRHRFECNPLFIEEFEKNGLVFSGRHPRQPIMQILEARGKKFFLATQFHPEFTSKPLKPNPCFLGFTKACLK